MMEENSKQREENEETWELKKASNGQEKDDDGVTTWQLQGEYREGRT